jgi:hypothetical protein
VDTVISEYVIPSISKRHLLSLQATRNIARDLFDRQVAFARQHRLREPNLKVTAHKAEFAAWHAIEYGGGVSEGDLEARWSEVAQSLGNFYQLRELIRILENSERLITQRTLTFSIDGIAARATPDLVAFRRTEPPLVVDWKTYIRDSQDHRLQLACYALALTTCKPHADFPSTLSRYCISDIELLEVQLMTGKLRPYKLTDEDVTDLEMFVADSATQISLAASASARKEIVPEKYPVAHSPTTCTYCPFPSLCWKG